MLGYAQAPARSRPKEQRLAIPAPVHVCERAFARMPLRACSEPRLPVPLQRCERARLQQCKRAHMRIRTRSRTALTELWSPTELRSLTALRTRIARKVRGRAVAMRRARQIARFRRNGFFADCMRRRVQVRFDANLRLVLLPAPRFPTHKAVPRPELERRIRARFDDEHT